MQCDYTAWATQLRLMHGQLIERGGAGTNPGSEQRPMEPARVSSRLRDARGARYLRVGESVVRAERILASKPDRLKKQNLGSARIPAA